LKKRKRRKEKRGRDIRRSLRHHWSLHEKILGHEKRGKKKIEGGKERERKEEGPLNVEKKEKEKGEMI